MSCTDLAMTGGSVAVQLLGGLGLLLLGLGIMLVVRRPRRNRPAVVVVALLVIGTVAGLSAPPAPAQAAGTCSLRIVQTSTMSGLAPGRAPDAITGLVTNNGTEETRIVAILVSIASVTTAPGAAAGTCDASDFTLLDPLMLIGVTLPPGGSTTFGGASIGFRNGPMVQNACKGATVGLAYATVP
jgi:hypothetical protein